METFETFGKLIERLRKPGRVFVGVWENAAVQVVKADLIFRLQSWAAEVGDEMGGVEATLYPWDDADGVLLVFSETY